MWRLDKLSFVRKSRLNCIGHVNSLENKRKVIEVLNTPHGSRLRGQPKKDGGILYKQILINAELQPNILLTVHCDINYLRDTNLMHKIAQPVYCTVTASTYRE